MFVRSDGERHHEGRSAPADARVPDKAQVRNFYSPDLATDPYVIEQQRKVVEALELACRLEGKRCREAGQARRHIGERTGLK
jgi:hypothetical protein